MKWVKRGLIFCAQGQGGWMNSHAQVPTVLVREKTIRVYFSSRPQRNLSLTGYLDLDINDPSKILHVRPDPILELGEKGMFDECGIMPSEVLEDNGKIWLYYGGWRRDVSIPYNVTTGLAVSSDGGSTFQKYGKGPILGRSLWDPYSATAPCILKENDGWHMWYCAGLGWLVVDGKQEHTYTIKYASSEDGVFWRPMKEPVVPRHNQDEAITRPSVIKIGRTYNMWFCYRGSQDFRDGKNSYRIGYAWSDNRTTWHRDDSQAGIDTSQSGWDSRMVAYPYVVKVKDKILMFYNGNGFGATGFGYATSED
jgi:predicted GH43/DUF377 family glycosyl hydrolase